jgi:quercetin dioxygenase-like cupin family protein
MDSKVIRSSDAKVFMDGDEFCRLYTKTEKITFGTSRLQPGQTGATDPGHPNGHEIFFCARGHAVVGLGDGEFVELYEGDALLIAPGVPHTLTNVGDEPALITWSLAPTENAADLF